MNAASRVRSAMSDNENYPTELISPDDAHCIRILGEVGCTR